MSDRTILGTSTIADRWRISLIKAVREELGEGVSVGDRVVYYEEEGKIVIDTA